MEPADRLLLQSLLTERRVLSLGVLVEGAPYVAQMPFAMSSDFGSLLVHASALGRHARGLFEGAPFSALIQWPDAEEIDPFQLPRVSLRGVVRPLDPAGLEFAAARQAYVGKLPSSLRNFQLGGFTLYRLEIERGRFVVGLAKTYNLSPGSLRDLGS